MTPTPGRIHQLPVKVLYSLEGGNQSYVTVLSDTQDVYVHSGPPEYVSDDEPGPVGSTYLKCVARGVCYASPECAPSASLDFSVYNLDPIPRHRPSTQPFASTSTSQHPHQTDEASWSGRGFLSWAMSESSSGSTLVKGRLTKEYDFEPSRFTQEGGLEALMRAGGSGGDGRGWGLEVVVSLKMVNPGGKGEFSGRQAFERMLYSGNGQASGSVLVATSPLRSNTVTNATANAPSPSMSFRPPPHTSDHRIPGSTPPVHNAGQGQGQQAPSPRAPANSTSARPPLPPARSSGSTLPPSSMPMAPSSSQSGTSRPPSTSGTARQPYRPPPAPHPPSSSASNSSAPARGQSNHPPQPPPSNVSKQNQNHPSSSASNHSTPNGKYQQPIPGPPPGSRHSRQVTPPPLPRPKSPPPTTPHRRALRDLLQADGKMSPSLAKELVNNPSLMALLKSIPSAARSPSGSGGEGSKRVKAEDSRSTRDETPTPTGPKTLPATAGKDGCSNCGTTETTMWRSKVYPDGTQTKVCDDCGVYFNKNKRMRPKELWGSQTTGEPSKRAKSTSANPTPPPGPAGVRQSPRLTRNAGSHGSPNDSSKGGPSSAPPAPFPSMSVHESPSKRRRSSKTFPQPSPRMATRSSAKSDAGAIDGSAAGTRTGTGTMDPFPFTNPAPAPGPASTPAPASAPAAASQETGTGMDDIDFEALLAQLTGAPTGPNASDHNGSGQALGLGAGFNLEDLFASVDNAAATDDALAEDMMKFLAGLENDADQQAGDSAQQQQP